MASFDPLFQDPTNWFDALWSVYSDPLGPVLPLVLGLGVMLSLAIVSDSIAVPTIVGILIAGSVVPHLPPTTQRFAMALIMLGAGLALWLAVTRSAQ